MELALICVRQVAALFVMIFAGFVCVRTGVVAMDAKKAFSNLLLGLVAPCMILNSYMAEFDWRTLQNLLLAGGLAVLLQGTAILAARLARPLFHGSDARSFCGSAASTPTRGIWAFRWWRRCSGRRACCTPAPT